LAARRLQAPQASREPSAWPRYPRAQKQPVSLLLRSVAQQAQLPQASPAWLLRAPLELPLRAFPPSASHLPAAVVEQVF